ncbi:hypothetical protein [Halalkalibacter sp. APA_J-10(15)]|uniref:hypothetical protein n=1 Tax=Halalkalibacter sp. APA_J-10(15) TaxID=2933805 RepID=UPI001FF32E50|nr:hypothetical protein [Halalkalibacter sp. APA_J-10(15)]MCK0470162.1 hypothetical protein [Halalkalibacter sp. APA_J-10(15)]
MRVKKILFLILTTLIVFSSFHQVSFVHLEEGSSYVGDLNVNIDISPFREAVYAGQDTLYHLTLKVTGSRTEYTDATIIVELPITDYSDFTQNLTELTINSQTPTYNETNHQLIYQFDSLQSGRSYETMLKVNTINGIAPNGTTLTTLT